MTTSTAGSTRRDAAMLDGQPRRRTTETKAAFKTTEFIAYVIAVVGVLIASVVVDGNGNGDNGAGGTPTQTCTCTNTAQTVPASLITTNDTVVTSTASTDAPVAEAERGGGIALGACRANSSDRHCSRQRSRGPRPVID